MMYVTATGPAHTKKKKKKMDRLLFFFCAEIVFYDWGMCSIHQHFQFFLVYYYLKIAIDLIFRPVVFFVFF
jgi:hypothetical protein